MQLPRLQLPGRLAMIAVVGLSSTIWGFGRFVSGNRGAQKLSRRHPLTQFATTRFGEALELPVRLVPRETGWGIYPATGDLDGDGRADLPIGGSNGRMQFRRNISTTERPAFAPPVWFDELCPNGRIPVG